MNYFTASALSDRASSLSSLLDGISNGIQTIQAASKGVDTVTSLVKQLQSVVSQAQSNAATNLPKLQGTAALATATHATAAGKSLRDTAMAKTVLGTAAADNVGVDATKADQIKLKAGNTDYTFTIGASDTVNDLVNSINKSGIAAAMGAQTPWDYFGIPEAIVTDAGSAFRSDRFRQVLADLSIRFDAPEVGRPNKRAHVERSFGTTRTQLLPNFTGQTFANIQEQG